MDNVYDKWERLVEAVLRREKLRELARLPSMSSTDSSITSDLSSRFSLSSPPQDHVPVTRPQAPNKCSSIPSARGSWRDRIFGKRNLAKEKVRIFTAEDIRRAALNKRSLDISRPQALNKSNFIPFAGNSLVNWIFGKRKLAKQKEFFQENGGFLPQPKLSGNLVSETFRIFTAEDLRRATNNYNERNIIGLGELRVMYKGILPDNRTIVVKESKTNDQIQIEFFFNEVMIVPKINHRNVLKLLGCCLEKETLTVVYEFSANGTLFSHIHDPILASTLSWDMRIKIAAEVAWVLAYLHSAATTLIVHGDVKSANIFLDETYTAKLGNFGCSRLVPNDHYEVDTVVGTLGYLDPEYLQTHKVNEKIDVYGFGVVLAELLTGGEAISSDGPKLESNLAVFFLSAIQEDRLVQILDVNLAIDDRIEQLANITQRCLRLHGAERPSMKEVSMELEALRLVENHPWTDAE